MRYDSNKDSGNSKTIARKHYDLRQMDKYIKWRMETKGYLKWKDLVEQQTHNNIIPHE